MVEHVLRLAATWTRWDGRPRPIDDRVYTPHKAIRRVADHMLDHIAQLEAHLTGTAPVAGSVARLDDHDGSGPRPLRWSDASMKRGAACPRLAQLWRLRLAQVPPEELDRAEGDAYTPREMAFCAVGSTYYADAIGELA